MARPRPSAAPAVLRLRELRHISNNSHISNINHKGVIRGGAAGCVAGRGRWCVPGYPRCAGETTIAIRSPNWQPKAMPAELVVDIDGVKLVLRMWPEVNPSGYPPVVLLPATGETAEDWDTVASALGASRTVYAVNLRGHGRSDWPGTYSVQLLAADVAGLLRRGLGRPQVDLIGHSLGGLVACSVAAAHPDLVHRLVLEDIGLLHPRRPAPPAKPEGILSFDWRVVEQVRPEIDNFHPRWGEVVASIAAPTLVVSGGPQSPVSPEEIGDLVQLLPRGQLITVDAAHLVHATKPDEFIKHALRFLNQ